MSSGVELDCFPHSSSCRYPGIKPCRNTEVKQCFEGDADFFEWPLAVILVGAVLVLQRVKMMRTGTFCKKFFKLLIW